MRIQAQRELYRTEEKRRIEEFADEFSREQGKRFTQSLELAKKRGIKVYDQIGDRKISLQQINDIGEPLYLGIESNNRSGQITRTNQLYSGGSLGLSLSGKSDTLAGKLAIWDGGGVLTTHQELVGRIFQQENTTNADLHSTHVAGTMVAGGVIASARGMSFGADLKVWDYNNDNAEISAASPNLLISNHSYGYQSGWVYDSAKKKWQWWGNDAISAQEDYKFGFYDSNAQNLDKIAFNAPFYLITKSAGNSRSENGPDFAKGEFYLLKNTRDSSNIIRLKNDGYDIISTTGNAKNILTVGAVESIQQAPNSPRELRVSNFSSWGPTDDGRIKPDIMGVGTDVLSTSNTANASYASLNGTSMASPNVAGSMFLLQQLYNRLNNGRFMRAATLKGLVIHTAMDFGPVGPDYQSGWGLLHAENAAKVIQNVSKSHAIRELSLNNGTIYTEKIIASGVGNIHATLSWTDPEGTVLPLVASSLNNRSPRLINDLDIKIQDSKGNFLPFILDPENPAALAKTGVNNLDNVEKINIPQSIPGETYTVTINHKGTLKNSQPQNFSLIFSGIGGKAYCSVAPTNKQLLITQLLDDKKSIANTLDSTGTTLNLEIGETKTVTLQLAPNTPKNVRASVDWNQDGDFDDANELISNFTGVVNNTLNLSVAVPSNTITANRYKMRIIVSTNPINSSCENINTGNIFEPSIEITQPSNDIAAISIASSSGSFCQNKGTINVLARLKNMGSKPQTNFPVRVNVFLNKLLLTTLNGVMDNILAGQEKEISLQGNVSLDAGETYTFELAHLLSTDQLANNNTIQLNQLIENPKAPIASGSVCTPGTVVNLTSNKEESLWYANNTLVGAGAKISLPASATYSVAQSDFSATLKPSSKAAFGTGTYFENFGPEPIIEVKSPIVLESARIYVGTSGTITFSVYNQDTGELIASVSKQVEATRTQSNFTRVNNQLIDDKNDPGQIVFLNLPFPKAGNYLLSQACSNGASIFRSNRILNDTINAPTNIGYPYTIPNILSITGAKFNGAPIASAYYYFYDMKFKSIGCPSPRTPVAVTSTPSPSISISPTGTLTTCFNESKPLVATVGENTTIQWLLNGAPIAGATKANFIATKAGSYQAQASNTSSCTSTSASFNLNYSSPVAPSVSYSSGILRSTGGGNLQWFLNGNLIPGATQATYLPTQSGNYTIKVTDINGCLASSENFTISILAAEELNPYTNITAFPNPTHDVIELGFPDLLLLPKQVKIQIWNNLGQMIQEQETEVKNHKISVDVQRLPLGNYLMGFPNLPNQKGIKFLKF
jgi:hypothetical protein